VSVCHTPRREIEAAILPVLRQHHIVYGIRFAESRHDPGIRIVLECIPRGPVLDHIEAALRRIVMPIPAKPTPIRVHIIDADPALSEAAGVTAPAQSEPSTPPEAAVHDVGTTAMALISIK
jgi:hypothetical protein